MKWLIALALLPVVVLGHGSSDDNDDRSPFPPETSSCCPQFPWLPKKLKALDERVVDFEKRNSRIYKRLTVYINEANAFEETQAKINDYIVTTKLGIYANGIKGNKGSIGVRGEEGEAGEPGQPGPEGFTGKVGRRGSPGSSGTPGERGPQGYDGFKGPEGPIGPAGASPPAADLENAGVKGDQGAQGQQGPPGETGPEGEPGDKGPPGYAGREGKKGLRGTDCCGKNNFDMDAWGEPEWRGALS